MGDCDRERKASVGFIPADEQAHANAKVHRSGVAVGVEGLFDLRPTGSLKVEQAVDGLGVVGERDKLNRWHGSILPYLPTTVGAMSARPQSLVERMRSHERSIFAEMSALAGQHDAINLGQGFPQEDGPAEIREAAAAAIAEGRGNQYPPTQGIPELRRAIAEHQRRFYGIDIDPDAGVVVATGASEIIQAALLALCEPGDEVVIFEPWFDLYGAGIDLAGATRVSVELQAPNFRPDLQALAAAITNRTRVLLVNSPHNPTGVVFTEDEMRGIANIAIANDLIVISDEVYEHLWFDQSRHVPMATIEGMAERTITVGSGGKMFSLTGWKVGWASGPADLIAAVRTVRQHLSFASGGPFQYAFAFGLSLPDDYFEGLRLGMQHRRDILSSGLTEVGFAVNPSQGTYFLTSDLGPFGFTDANELALWMPEHAGVAAIPLLRAPLGHHRVQQVGPDKQVGNQTLRWAFCKSEQMLNEAVRRLQAAVDQPSTQHEGAT